MDLQMKLIINFFFKKVKFTYPHSDFQVLYSIMNPPIILQKHCNIGFYHSCLLRFQIVNICLLVFFFTLNTLISGYPANNCNFLVSCYLSRQFKGHFLLLLQYIKKLVKKVDVIYFLACWIYIWIWFSVREERISAYFA